MDAAADLIADREFRREARAFAEWFGLERRAVLELGRIAAGWLEHYSRTRNAERLAEALDEVTGLRITGRTIQNYRDIFLLDESWRSCPRRHAECRNDFEIRHVSPGHLRVVAGGKITDERQHRLLDEIERDFLTVKKAKALVREAEIEQNRKKRTVRLGSSDPRVVCGDATDVVQRTKRGSIHHLFCDWPWQNTGIWRASERRHPVYRPHDPAKDLCRFLEATRSHLHANCIVWIFSKTTAFEDGQIGLPWKVQETAHRIGLKYCSEYIVPHTISGYRSTSTFLAVKHLPLHAFVPQEYDFDPVTFAPSVGQVRTPSNHISQARDGDHKHPYEKPVELFVDLIKMGTPGGLVFDGFAGSGAAGVAAVRCGCGFLGAEKQAYYIKLSNRRIACELAQHPSGARCA